MIRSIFVPPLRVICVLLALVLPADATTLDAFEGRWQGEGALTLGDEPAQRFRCRIRLRSTGPRQSFFSGRCASAQGSQSFSYMLFDEGGGALSARNWAERLQGGRARDASDPPPDGLPQVMQGQVAPDLLWVADEDGARFELRLEAGGLAFRIAGPMAQGNADSNADRRAGGRAEGRAQMTRSD